MSFQEKRLKVLVWHIHGSYLYYLSHANCDFYLPVTPERSEGYGGRSGAYPWGDNVIEVPAEQVRHLDLDCIVLQTPKNYFEDQYRILSAEQLSLPKIYIQHDPPREHPTDTRHWVDDPHILLVQVTHFNDLMWDSGRTPTTVIDHGVVVPPNVEYSGELDRGIVVINNIKPRGRRLGWDIFEKVRKVVPIDLVGIGAFEVGGLGEVPHDQLPEFTSHYRFFFNPIRYTSLGLAVIEAMMIGMPIVGMATTEMVTTIHNDVSGYLYTDLDQVIEKMCYLLDHPQKAMELGRNAQAYARQRFNIERFAHDWNEVFRRVAAQPAGQLSATIQVPQAVHVPWVNGR